MFDTDTASYIIKGRTPQAEAKLSAIEPSMICISVMTRAELLDGLKRLPPCHRLHTGVRQFLKIVRALPWDIEAADFYAEIRHQFAATGQTHWRSGHDDRGTFPGCSGSPGNKQRSPLRTDPGASYFGGLVE
jgi:predicted nucleic acid-binding protein